MKHLDTLRQYLPTLGNGEPLTNQEALERCMSEIRNTIEASILGRKPSISPSGTENAPRYFKHILDGNTDVFNPDQFKPQAKLKMLINSVVEHVIVLLMEEAGINVEAPKNKMHVKIETPAGNIVEMAGSYDYTINGKIVDAKVVNKENFQGKFKSAKHLASNDIFGYLLQGYLYETGEGKPFYGWDVFCGDDYRFKHISSRNIQQGIQDKLERFGRRYDEALEAESAYDLPLCYPLETKQTRLINGEFVQTNEPLTNPFTGEEGTRIAWQCSRCPFRDSCFKNLTEERKPNDGVRHWL